MCWGHKTSAMIYYLLIERFTSAVEKYNNLFAQLFYLFYIFTFVLGFWLWSDYKKNLFSALLAKKVKAFCDLFLFFVDLIQYEITYRKSYLAFFIIQAKAKNGKKYYFTIFNYFSSKSQYFYVKAKKKSRVFAPVQNQMTADKKYYYGKFKNKNR